MRHNSYKSLYVRSSRSGKRCLAQALLLSFCSTYTLLLYLSTVYWVQSCMPFILPFIMIIHYPFTEIESLVIGCTPEGNLMLEPGSNWRFLQVCHFGHWERLCFGNLDFTTGDKEVVLQQIGCMNGGRKVQYSYLFCNSIQTCTTTPFIIYFIMQKSVELKVLLHLQLHSWDLPVLELRQHWLNVLAILSCKKSLVVNGKLLLDALVCLEYLKMMQFFLNLLLFTIIINTRLLKLLICNVNVQTENWCWLQMEKSCPFVSVDDGSGYVTT